MSAFTRKPKVQAPHTAAVEYLSRDLSNKIRYEVNKEIKDYKQELTKANHPLAIRDINNELTALEEFKAWATYKNNLPPASLREINIDIQGSSVAIKILTGLVALDKEKEIPDEFRTWAIYTNNLANRIAKAEGNITLAALTHKIDDEVEICYELAHISERSVTVYIEQSFKLPKELTGRKLDKLAKRVLKMRSAKRSAYSAKLAKIKMQRREPKILREKKLNKILMYEHAEYLANLSKIKKELKQRWCKKVDEVMMQRRVERRKLNKLIRHDREAIALHLGVVGGRGYNHKRCTKACYLDQSHRNAKNERWLENTVAIGEGGEVIKLSDAAQTKRKQVCEMYAFAKGIQEHAKASDMQWATIVVTLPPEYHPNPLNDNSSWYGILPSQASRKLQHNWEKVRAQAAKAGITIAGLRTVESHQDGCPHINYLVFFDNGYSAKVEQWFRDQFGHSDKAVTFKAGITGEGYANFATYAFKYFSKYFNNEPDEATISEQAWASTWSIRRYAFLGIPKKSMWQKLRSQTVAPQDNETKALWRAARGGRAALFISLCGGLAIKDKDRPFRVYSVLHRKSRVNVGVENVANGAITICKRLGYWRVTDKNSEDARRLIAATLEEKNNNTKDQHKADREDKVTVNSNYPSKTQNQNPEPVKPEKLPIEAIESPPASQIRLKNHHEAQQKRAVMISHRQAAVAAIVKRRRVHPGYLYRMQMINADLGAIGQVPISGLDSIQ